MYNEEGLDNEANTYFELSLILKAKDGNKSFPILTNHKYVSLTENEVQTSSLSRVYKIDGKTVTVTRGYPYNYSAFKDNGTGKGNVSVNMFWGLRSDLKEGEKVGDRYCITLAFIERIVDYADGHYKDEIWQD